MNYKKKTLLLIVIATLVRSIIAATIELGNDEVYYRMYAQYLQWNYFDHPPMVGWLIRFTTANLLLDHEFFIRLGAIVSAAITTWFLFLSGKKLNNEYTGFLAAIIYTATIYGSIIAGTFILPDSPQMVCWAAGLYLLIGITENKNINTQKKKSLLLFGIIAGVGMLCKIHTSFLWLGFLLYVLFYHSKWLQQPMLYIAGIITILFFYPVIQWNIDNHFVTYLYHSKRVDVASGGLNFDSFITFSVGQLLYFNPVIFPFLVIGTVASFKNNLPVSMAHKRLLLFSALPLIVIATLVSFFKEVLPHWTGPAYTGIVLLTACYFSAKKSTVGLQKNVLPKPLLIATSLLSVIVVAGILVINFFPGTLGKKNNQLLGEGDFTLDMHGWNKLKAPFKKIVEQDTQTSLMKPNSAVICNRWFTAAHIDYYIAMPLKTDLIALADTNDIHQYAWINTKRKTLLPGDDAYCIVSSENYFNVPETYGPLFQTILPPEIIEQQRAGVTCRKFYVYRLKNYKEKL